jgi:hypothetical protein
VLNLGTEREPKPVGGLNLILDECVVSESVRLDGVSEIWYPGGTSVVAIRYPAPNTIS